MFLPGFEVCETEYLAGRRQTGALDIVPSHSRETLESLIKAVKTGKLKPQPGQYERWVRELAVLVEMQEQERRRKKAAAAPPEPVVTLLPTVTETPPLPTSEHVSEAAAPGPVWPEWLECYPAIGLGAIANHHGRAWLVWAVSRALAGDSGRVPRETLVRYLVEMGVGERQRRRWIADAFSVGLFTGSRAADAYYPVRQDRAAVVLGARSIWRRAKIRIADLFKPGWRRFVWAGFLATLCGKPMSQMRKFEITGVEPRMQRLYQAENENGETLSYPTYHYSDSPVDPVHAGAMKELTGFAYFVTPSGEVKQRLPDGRVVHPDVSQRLPDGRRSRDIRSQFEAALHSLVGLETSQGNGRIERLFHDDHKQTKRTLKRLAKSDSYDRPLDIFEAVSTYGRVKNYRAVQAC